MITRKIFLSSSLCLCSLIGVADISHAATLEELLVAKGVITKAEASAASTASTMPARVYYKEGTRIEFPDAGFTTKINTFIQPRYTFTDNDGGDNTSSFDNQKARLIVSGTALHNEFNYYMQTDFVGTSQSGEKSPTLLDAYIEWSPCEEGGVRMGQYKTAISRQFVNSDYKLQFPDRSRASDLFSLGRQQGVSGSWALLDGQAKLTAGVFNGESVEEGRNRPGVDTKHTGVTSIRFNPVGTIDAYEEGDVNHSQELGLSFGAAYAYSDSSNDLGSEEELLDLTKHTLSVDANLKIMGLGVHGEFYWQRLDPETSSDAQDPVGGYVQAGYFVLPSELEIAARYGIVECDGGLVGGVCRGADKVNQATASINYFFWKHSLKAQLAYDFLNQDVVTDDVNTNRWIFQLTGYF